MANLFYKDHFITVVGHTEQKFLNFGFLWLTSVGKPTVRKNHTQ